MAQWRGAHVLDSEKAAKVRTSTPGQIIPKLLSEIRFEKRRADIEIVSVWNQSIDPSIVAHAQPTGLRNGTLFVTVDSSVWLAEIVRFGRREILERMQHSFGLLIKKISYRVG